MDRIFSYLITDEDWAQAELQVKNNNFYGNEFSISKDPNRLIYAACGEIALRHMLPSTWRKVDISGNKKSDLKVIYTNQVAYIEVKTRLRTVDLLEHYEFGFEQRQHSDFFQSTHVCFFNINKTTRVIDLVGILTIDDWKTNAELFEKGQQDASNNFVEHAAEYKMTAAKIRELSVHNLFLTTKPKNNMSTYQKKDGDISVFTNNSDNANAPSWKGNLLLNGVEYQVALWRKQGAKGEFLAGNVQVKQQPSPNSADYYAGKPKAESHVTPSNDLPF